MDAETYTLLGVGAGAAAVCIAAIITGNFLLRTARISAEKDFKVQEKALTFEKTKVREALKRERLESLHQIMSKINRENSLVMSYIRSDQNMEPQRYHDVYDRNCDLLDEASVIVDFYYPDFSDSIEQLIGQANVFWGHQQALLKIDISEDPESYKKRQLDIISAGEEIRQVVDHVKGEISKLAQEPES